MKKNILVCWGSNFNSHLSKFHISVQTDLVKLYPENNYFLFSTVKRKTLPKILNTKKFTHIINYRDDVGEIDSWRRYYEYLEEINKTFKFDKIWLFSAPLLVGFSRGREDQIVKFYEKMQIRDDYSVSFVAMRKFWERMFLPFYYTKVLNIPIYHFIMDSLEPNFNQFNPLNKRFFFYDDDRLECQYFPFLEYAFIYEYRHKLKELFITKKIKKEYDITFGMTNVMKEIEHKNDTINKIYTLMDNMTEQDISFSFFFKDKINKIQNFVHGELYNDEYIAKSKYTLIIPSYDEEDFSLGRLVESIVRSCVPLIYNANYDKIKNNFPEYYSLIKELNLETTIEEIPEKIKNLDYDFIIDKLTSSWDCIKLLRRGYYEEYIEKFPEIFK